MTPINVDSSETVTVGLNPAVTQSVFVRVKGIGEPRSDPRSARHGDQQLRYPGDRRR